MTRNNLLTAVNIRYLLTINELDNGDRGVGITEISKSMDVAKSSVHTMVKRFCEIGLASKEKYDKVHLTEAGRLLAEKYSLCFDLLYKSLNVITDLPNEYYKNAVCAVLSQMSENELNSFSVKCN